MTFLDPPYQNPSLPPPLPLARLLPGPTAPPVDVNYQRNLASLTNKYRDLSSLIAQLPNPIRSSLINFDSRRVALGSAPMTRQQTLNAIQTALTNQQATPEPQRNPLSILKNFGSDLSTILHAIPRLPWAAVHEIQDLGNIPQSIAKAQQQGANPIQAILQAPGVRLIPGTYTLGNALGGPQGLQEAASHPLLTFLDVLPLAHQAAAATRVGQLAEATRAAEGLRPRPISAVLTNRLTPEGTLVRNPLGQLTDTFRNETRIGQTLEAFGGQRARDVSRMAGRLDQRLKSLALGYGTPQSTIETFANRTAHIFEKYTDEYPFLSKKSFGPQYDTQRAQFYDAIQRNPDQYNPSLVNELRDLQYDFAKFNQSRGLLDQFNGEWYPIRQATQLRRSEELVRISDMMRAWRNSYLNPSGNLTPPQFLAMVDDVVAISNPRIRLNAARALESTLDAYSIPITAMKGQRAALHRDIGSWTRWADETRAAISSSTPIPRRSLPDILATLRTHRLDRQANLLEAYLKDGNRNEVTARLKNLADRRPPTFPEAEYPGFRDDVRSMSRRIDFDNRIGSKFTDKRHLQRVANFERRRDRMAPARFHGLLSDEVLSRTTKQSELGLGRQLTPEEAGQLTAAVQGAVWDKLPGIPAEEAQAFMRQTEKEVTQTWRALRDAGHDPVFVHKVTPRRTEQTLTGKIGPVPQEISQTKERVLDLTPGVRDLQVSLTHQATELLARDYSERFIEQVIDSVGVPESQLKSQLLSTARWRAGLEPSLDVGGHLPEIMNRAYEKFNPREAGFSWGGARLDKFDPTTGGQTYYIPKSIAQNLHRYAKRPSILSTLFDPINKAFRYNVIGLSPSVIVNNFFSNSVAMMAEVGPRPLQYFSRAREWLANPERIPNEELKAMVLAETPHMEHLNREAWLASRTGQKFMQGYNAGRAFQDSAASTALRNGKRGLDQVVRKSLRLQQWSDNIYRAMTYMDQVERGTLKGLAKDEAAHAALETVRRTFVDYASFTPIERSAMRTVIPFYSYMGHAARFIARYPLDHPLRASIASHLAEAERERLGALPGSFLSMIPLTGISSTGNQILFNLRPFDPFGDTASLATVAGWLSAMNPAIQTALRQVGVIRGEADIYPTLRYDPETGRMRAVHPNLISDLFYATMPRLGLATTVLGLNPDYNELRTRDRAAANRMLLSAAGIPRAWRQMNIPQEQFKGENARSTAARDVLNNALSSGNWKEALRYPSLRGYYEALNSLPPETIRAMTPDTQRAIADQILQLTGS